MKIGPKYKIAKRLGRTVFDKTQTPKFALSADRHAKTKKMSRGASDYGKQLLEKQKVRITYGITERQFRNYVRSVMETHHKNPAETLHRMLEMRLDNVVYRLGLAKTRRHARQVVSHGHILVNGKRITIPSHMLHLGDAVEVREGSKRARLFESTKERLAEASVPSWLVLDEKVLSGSIKKEAPYTEMEAAGDLGAVLSFYSR
jgi:small subunit ribosomal protein S4